MQGDNRDEILVERAADSADEVKLPESREFAIHLLGRESRGRKDSRNRFSARRTFGHPKPRAPQSGDRFRQYL